MSTSRPVTLQEARATLRLAGPVVATMLAQISMGFVDTVMVGRLGPEALAGVALGNTLYVFCFVVCLGFITAVGPMVSQAYGAGEWAPIGRTVRQGMWLAVLLSLPAGLLLWNLEAVLLAAGQAPEVVDRAVGYLRAVLWGLPLALSFIALRNFVEALSRPALVTGITAVGVLVNVGANYVLMFGKLGFPALGLVGTGWATSVVNAFLFLVLAVCVARLAPFRRYRVFEGFGRPDPEYFRELFRIGWPIGVSFGIEHGLFTLTALMMGWLGATQLAAHQIALQCAAMTFMVPLGIGIAASVRVGQAAGREDVPGVRRAGYTGIVLAAAAMSAAAILFWTVPEPIVAVFIDAGEPGSAEVRRLAALLLGVAAVFQVFDGLQVAASGALRGLKDTRIPMLIALFSYWLLGLSCGYVLGFALDLGAVGLWWGLVLGLASAAVLLIRRFQRHTDRLTAAAEAPDTPAEHLAVRIEE